MIRQVLAVAAIGLVALAVARRMGGGDEIALPPPHAAALPDAASDELAVAYRLVDRANDATFDFPNADAARPVLKAHWRQLRPPFVPLHGDAARFVTSIALRTSASETQWAMAFGEQGKESWAPDARIWNMNEGSFDQREALVAPAPGEIRFHLALPAGARLTFAEGTVNATDVATVFTVTVVDDHGAVHEVLRDLLPPSAARRWTERSVDLAAFAGRTVDLRLATSTASAAEAAAIDAGETREPADLVGAGNGRPTLDGGVVREELLATPGNPVALWGNPTVLARGAPEVPFNVLWFVVDALRPDVVPSFHDDAADDAKRHARFAPLEAMLPKVDGLMPSIDELARRGARFTNAYSAGSWTRPGTLAMLAGARSSELGIETTSFLLEPAALRRFYADEPPLLPLVLRRHGVLTRAFVNNYFMAGYAPVGLDMGFERVADHRYRTKDTWAIAEDARRFLVANKDTRFFAFVNFNSPHEPYEPPPRHLARLPEGVPADTTARLYMAEAAKDDEAIGLVMKTIDELGLRERTIVVVTADHGETMSSVHAGNSGLENMPIRYHHAVSNYEETTKVPLVVVAPKLTPGSVLPMRCRTTDIAPTVLDLLGLEPPPRTSGRSLVGLEKEPEARVVVSESRGSRAILHDHWHLIVREGAAKTITRDGQTRDAEVELFDLSDDPGERNDVAKRHPDVVAEMKARLAAALVNAPAADARTTPAADAPVLHLRFVGGPAAHRITGTIRVGDAQHPASRIDVTPVDAGRDAFVRQADHIDVALHTDPALAVGVDLVVEPPTTPITWDLWLDDAPSLAVFGGPFGLRAPALDHGVETEAARAAAAANALPVLDPRRDRGLFVAREHAHTGAAEPAGSDEGAEEMARLLREWGYARGKK